MRNGGALRLQYPDDPGDEVAIAALQPPRRGVVDKVNVTIGSDSWSVLPVSLNIIGIDD